MKKIKNDTYLELSKCPDLILNVHKLSNKVMNTDYINEFKKYLSESVNKNILNDKNEYIIYKEIMKIISSLYFFDEVEFDKMLNELLMNEFLIKNEDGTYSFNEEIYNRKYVIEEKKKFKQFEYKLIHIRYPWNVIERENEYVIQGYSNKLQRDINIASIIKGHKDCDKAILDILALTPWRFKILCKSLKYINNDKVIKNIDKVLNLILNFNQRVYVISSKEEYNSFISNKNDNKLEILDISKMIGIDNTYEIIDNYSGNITIYANDENKEELMGCISLIMNKDLLFYIIFEIANSLPKTNELYKEILAFANIDEETLELFKQIEVK